MKRMRIILVLTATICLHLFSSLALAQADKSKRPSPPATATGKIGSANISIIYSSPAVKSRKIWGELVPYDKVWRAGANEATIFETDADIKVGGKPLVKGRYSIYMIPTESEWQVILNSEVGQWGIARGGVTTRNPEKDVVIIKAKPVKNEFKESLEYKVQKDGFSLSWENLQVLISVEQ